MRVFFFLFSPADKRSCSALRGAETSTAMMSCYQATDCGVKWPPWKSSGGKTLWGRPGFVVTLQKKREKEKKNCYYFWDFLNNLNSAEEFVHLHVLKRKQSTTRGLL